MLWSVSPGGGGNSGGGGISTSVLTLGQLNAVNKLIPIYDSDTVALAGGLGHGDTYRAGPNHFSAKEGTEIIIP